MFLLNVNSSFDFKEVDSFLKSDFKKIINKY